jgi:hypothetical protein
MTLRQGFLWGIGLLLGLQLATSFASIGLLARTSPAVQEILAENVYSNEAAEQMLEALVLHEAGPEGDHRAEFAAALQRARNNVTEPEEVPVIEAIGVLGERVFAGDREAVTGTIASLRDLVQINRRAMQRANERAQRLGTTGAWAAVVLSLIALLVSALVVKRTLVAVIEPVEELEDALVAYRSGDAFRRCQGRAASAEMRRVLGTINVLLERAHRGPDEPTVTAAD